jgi:hypothetical protein
VFCTSLATNSRQTELIGQATAAYPASSFGKDLSLSQPLFRIVAIDRHAPVVLANSFTRCRPPFSVHAKVFGTSGWIEWQVGLDGRAQDVHTRQLAEDRAGKRHMAPQCGVMRVVDHMVTKQPIGTDLAELASSVDQQGARMPRCDRSIDRAKRCLASDRQSVVIECGKIVRRRLGYLPV